MADPDEVARLYDAAPERELHRLDERRVEFGVTCRALEEFLPPPPATILDVGSGPGRYAFYLISRGYSVSLVDVSRECLSLAEREATRLDLPLGEVVHGDATDLSSFPEAAFDAVLLLGPLYHLKLETARERAVNEALRVVRPGGIIFSAFLNRYSAVRYAAKKRPEQFLEDPELIESILSTSQIVLATTGVIQTIPSLALLVFMIPLLGIGAPPAIAALFLYSLLPIVRNTYTGLHDIPDALRESAEALGLPARARLRLVELPMASRAILAGIKTSAVINVGTATLGALIGAGGYGQPILTGIRLDDTGLILQGAIPAAALALIVQGGFELAERVAVPRGLRLVRGA